MGLLKKFCEITGELTGTVLGETVKFVGDVTNSDFVKDIGEGVYQTTKNSGKLLGQAAEGTYNVAKGIINNNEEEIGVGFKDVGEAASTTVTGIGKGIKNIASSGFDVVDGVVNGDDEKAKNAAKNLIKTAAIGAIGLSVLDGLDVIGDDAGNASFAYVDNDISDADLDYTDSIDSSDDLQSDTAIDDVDNGDSYVDPHWVNCYTRDDGTVVDGYWRDGDGDTGHDLTKEQGGGYFRNI